MAKKQSRYKQKVEAGAVPHSYLSMRRTLRRAKELGINEKGKHMDTLRKIIRKKEDN